MSAPTQVAKSELVPLPSGVDLDALPPDSEQDPMGEEAEALHLKCAGHHVNTYTWTKCIAEHVVSRYARQHGMQLTIMRPSIIGPAWKFPQSGWATSASPCVPRSPRMPRACSIPAGIPAAYYCA